MEVGENMSYNNWLYCEEPSARFVSLSGAPIKHTPISHPYSYDTYLLWKGDYAGPGKTSVEYSDRLYQWNSEEFDRCCREAFGNTAQCFDNRRPEAVEKFLSLYLGKEIKLTAIEQGCNLGNGYPYWIFHYEEIKEETK